MQRRKRRGRGRRYCRYDGSCGVSEGGRSGDGGGVKRR